MTTWRSRGYLPHIDGLNLIQHITFHVADSLPRQVVERMNNDLIALPPDQQDPQRRQRIMDFLDAGHGTCPLSRPDCAEAVQESLLQGDIERYRLLAWTIMPNHVHVLIQTERFLLAKIVQSWKRHTSREIHRILDLDKSPNPSPSAAFWHREYWDPYIRNEKHFFDARNYIEENPVKAGLIDHRCKWKWSSAFWTSE